jgi:hypothetical protein
VKEIFTAKLRKSLKRLQSWLLSHTGARLAAKNRIAGVACSRYGALLAR